MREHRQRSAAERRGRLPRLELQLAARLLRRRSRGERRAAGRARRAAAPRRGCYAAHSGIKRWNRRAEHCSCARREVGAVADGSAAQPYPRDGARPRPGSSSCSTSSTTRSPAPRSSRRTTTRATSSATRRSLAAARSTARSSRIARQIDIPHEEEMRPGRRLQPAPVAGAGRRRGRVHVAAADGRARRRRRGRAGADAADPAADDDDRRSRAARVPGGAAAARLPRLPRAPGRRRASRCAATDTTLENDHLAARGRPGDGAARAARAKATGADVAAPGGAHAVVVDDRTDTWGHGVGAYDDVARGVRVRCRCGCSSRPGAGDPPRREPLRRLDAARGATCWAPTLALRRRARRARLARAAEAAEAALSRPPSSRGATFEIPVRPRRARRRPATRSRPVVGRRLRRRARAGGAERRQVRLRRAAAATSAISAVRSPVGHGTTRGSSSTDGDYEYMDQGRAALHRPARPACRRLARRRASSAPRPS